MTSCLQKRYIRLWQCPKLEGYKMTGDVAKRYAELCAGKPENRFDRVLREKVYPILAWMQSCSPITQH